MSTVIDQLNQKFNVIIYLLSTLYIEIPQLKQENKNKIR